MEGYVLSEPLRKWLDAYIESIKTEPCDSAVAVMTDMHTESQEPFAVMNYLACSGAVDMCVTLGDIIPSRYEDKALAVEVLRKAFQTLQQGNTKACIFPLRGNHDVNPVKDFDVTKMISNREYYLLSGNDSRPGLAGENLNYGFVDLEKAKVRLILMDTSDIFDDSGKRLSTNNEVMILQQQFDWFCHSALNLSEKAEPGEWAVMVLAHASMEKLCPNGFRAALDAFTAGKALRGTYPYNSAGYVYELDVTVDFTRQGPGQFICSVSGHEHRDSVNMLGVYPEVYTICYSEGCYHYDAEGNWVWYEREPGTVLEHCVDTVLLNRTQKTATFRRFGVGGDRVIHW